MRPSYRIKYYNPINYFFLIILTLKAVTFVLLKFIVSKNITLGYHHRSRTHYEGATWAGGSLGAGSWGTSQCQAATVRPTPQPGAGKLGDTGEGSAPGIGHLTGDAPRRGQDVDPQVGPAQWGPWPHRQGCGELEGSPAVVSLGQGLTVPGGCHRVLGHGLGGGNPREAGQG